MKNKMNQKGAFSLAELKCISASEFWEEKRLTQIETLCKIISYLRVRNHKFLATFSEFL